MRTSEDDFGKARPRATLPRKAPGIFTPRDLIGKTLTECQSYLPADGPWPRHHEIPELARMSVASQKNSDAFGDSAYAARPQNRGYGTNMRSEIDEAVYGRDMDFSGEVNVDEELKSRFNGCAGRSNQEIKAAETRRMRMPVFDRENQIVDCQRMSDGRTRPEGIRQVDETPMPQKHPYAGSKRCFDWKHKPTAWDNPVTYEEPTEPGKRPTHPVCVYGAVAIDRRKDFPDRAYTATGIPPPKMNKQPVGNEWGGWAKDGSPGRCPADGPWQVIPRQAGEDAEADFRVSDARVKRFPEMKYGDTTHITRWHFDCKHHIDPIKGKQITKLQPVGDQPDQEESVIRQGREMLWRPPAGVPSGMQVEGTCLESYECIRRRDREKVTARKTALN